MSQYAFPSAARKRVMFKHMKVNYSMAFQDFQKMMKEYKIGEDIDPMNYGAKRLASRPAVIDYDHLSEALEFSR